MTEDDGLSSLLQRVQWRIAASDWLKERSQYSDSDLDACLSRLEENPALREAALAAFWGTYLANELPPKLRAPQEDKLRSLLERIPPPDSSPKDARDLAFVKLHLALLLAICLIRPDCPISENPSVADMLEKALAARRLLEEPSTGTEIVDDPCGWGLQHFDDDLFAFSVVLLLGIAGTELAFWHKEQRRFEDAFGGITNAAWDIYATTITESHTGESTRDGFQPYLPHSNGPFSVQEAVDIFEEVKGHSRNVADWDRIETACVAIQFLGHNGAYDLLENVTDASGHALTALEYWGKGATFAEERRLGAESPYRLVTREMMERMEIVERLKRDFLRDLWNEMDKKTQDILLDAETQWMHGRPDNMVNDLRQMLELVLPSVFPSLEPATKQNDRERRLLMLTRWRDALRDRAVQARVDGLKLGDHDKTRIKRELPVFLQKVIEARNYFEHEDARKRSDIIEKATAIHDELLGIGRDGVLPWLMRIKRDTGARPKAGS